MEFYHIRTYNGILFYWHTASWILIGCALLLLLYALFFRKSRHPVCRSCGYDLGTNTNATQNQQRCPECGTKIGRNPNVRPLNRKLIVIAGIVFLTSQFICIIPRAQHSGPIAFIPTWLLTIAVPLRGALDDPQRTPFPFESSPYWYDDCYFELRDRLTLKDHNWLHIKLVEWRNSSNNFDDIVPGLFSRAYLTPVPTLVQRSSNFLRVAHSQLSFGDPDLFDSIEQTLLNRENAYLLSQHELILASSTTHAFIHNTLNAWLMPYDEALTAYPLTEDVPKAAHLLESTRYLDVAESPAQSIPFASLASVIKAATGLELVWSCEDTSEPLLSSVVFDSKYGPSLSAATLADLLDHIILDPACNLDGILRWYIHKNKIHLCSSTRPPLIAIAYDLRVSGELPSHKFKVQPDDIDPNYSMLTKLQEQIHTNAWVEQGGGEIETDQPYERFVILAPTHIHARIQRYLPRIREGFHPLELSERYKPNHSPKDNATAEP